MVTSGATKILIVGAGPYGLALAAQCLGTGVDHVLVGESMAFWKTRMPPEMLLRSRSDWHLDPFERDTIEQYWRETGTDPQTAHPISLERYLAYCAWFQERSGIVAEPLRIVSLSAAEPGGPARFVAQLEDGTSIGAESVVVTAGWERCSNVPPEFAGLLPAGTYRHVQDAPDPAALAGKALAIVGGRQSAFEWAALAAEAGAAPVHVCYRHATPSFAEADWSWTNELLDRSEREPGWYRRLSQSEKDAIAQRMWSIGRGQLEPWLGERVTRPEIVLHPCTRLTGGQPRPDGRLAVALDDGSTLVVDDVLLATGYKTDVARIPFLARGGLLERIAVTNGYPDLSEDFESSVPGLFFSNRFATKDFGNFYDFTAGCRASARTIGARLASFSPDLIVKGGT